MTRKIGYRISLLKQQLLSMRREKIQFTHHFSRTGVDDV